MTNDVCIVGAKRTPIGRFLGSLSKLSAVDLAVHAAEAAIDDLPKHRIDQVIVGNVLSAGLGMNVARQVGVKLGLPLSAPAFTVNMMCGSGLQSLVLAAQAIRAGDANVILCGGTESMTNAPHVLTRSRPGIKLGDGKLVDTILKDGLLDAFDDQHMATGAEQLAKKFDISRQAQDKFAASSQQRYATAHAANVFADELMTLPKLSADEHPRSDTTAEQLADLRPAFDKGGSITAGNASGINDGAAMLVVARRSVADENGWPVLAVVGATSTVGCDPAEMGLGPVHAIRQLCSAEDCNVNDFDAIEINEAFAAQTLACLKELNLSPEDINPHGGAIALGHPIGASGARLAAHLTHQIASGKIRSGLASLCVGGGMGVGVVLRRP